MKLTTSPSHPAAQGDRLTVNDALGVACDIAGRLGGKKPTSADAIALRGAFARAQDPGRFIEALLNTPMFEGSTGLDLALLALSGGGMSGLGLSLNGFAQLAGELVAQNKVGRPISANDLGSLSNYMTLMGQADRPLAARLLAESPLFQGTRKVFAPLAEAFAG